MGKPRVDRTGHIYGELKVIRLHDDSNPKYLTWLCECSCGNTRIAIGCRLQQGAMTSCRECVNLSLRKLSDNLVGRKFGHLVVLRYAGRDTANLWECQCKCGRKPRIREYRLLQGQGRCFMCARTKHNRTFSHEYEMLTQARSRAKQDGMEFNLDWDDIRIPDVCPCLGIPLQKKVKASRCLSAEEKAAGVKYRLNDRSASLDRIDSSKGYIKGNVWVISSRANRIKNNSMPDELRMIADAVEAKVKEING